MAIEQDWAQAFQADKKGSAATRDRAYKTWVALRSFASQKKWDLAPGTITPKQMRIFLDHRATVVSPRSVQNEASHIRRALAGAGREVGDVRDPKNPWSSERMQLAEGSRIGGKAAADPAKWAVAKPLMPSDVQAVVGLIEEIGMRCKEAVMAGPSLREWGRELEKQESKERGCFLNVSVGTKGGRPRFTFVPPGRVEATQKAVSTAQAVEAIHKGNLIDAPDLKSALKRYSNALSRHGMSGTDSGHGLRRAWAQQQFGYYRNSGMRENDALKRLSNDLGHGDGRGRWVWNNYLLGGAA